jgi:hypothetical protein
MGIFRQGQADKLANLKRDVDAGNATEADLTAEARKSTGNEIDAAMRQSGENWN